jgi:hypothetical protein
MCDENSNRKVVNMKAWQSITMLLISVCAGCVSRTSFTGEPKVPGGRAGCEQMCAREGLEFGGMVLMGQYSTACICNAPGQKGGRPGGAVSVAGVILQMQAEEEAARQSAARH